MSALTRITILVVLGSTLVVVALVAAGYMLSGAG